MTDRGARSSTDWQARFEAFASRKTREASAAVLPPFITELDREPPDVARIEHLWTARLFDGPFYVSNPRRKHVPACSLVFVQSADGNTGAADPSTLGGGNTDKHLIYEGLSRVAADAVLAGAETIRGTDVVFSVWHPELVSIRQSFGLPRHPRQVVATRRGVDLDDTLLFNVPDVPAIIITTDAGARAMTAAVAARPWVGIIRMNSERDIASGFEQLRAGGIQRLGCVGGRHLARQLLDASLVDDLYLTTSPHAGGEPNSFLYDRPLPGQVVVRKRGTGPEAGVIFEHWRMS